MRNNGSSSSGHVVCVCVHKQFCMHLFDCVSRCVCVLLAVQLSHMKIGLMTGCTLQLAKASNLLLKTHTHTRLSIKKVPKGEIFSCLIDDVH